MIVLRSDQAALKQSVYQHWNSGARNVLAVLPTGGGKSVVVSDIVLDKHRAGKTQCVIAHRTELVGQMTMHIARRGIEHRIIGPKNLVAEIRNEQRREFGRSFENPSAKCTVAGIDTLNSRVDELKAWGAQVEDWTIDEAHHVLRENKWGRGTLLFPNAYGLGVTATPQRADGMGLGSHADGLFDVMTVGPSMRELIDMGGLCDYQIVVPESDFAVDESAFGKDGDLSPAKGRLASKESHIVGDIVDSYIKWAYGKRGITFATDVETANEIAAKFNAAGIPAAAVSAKTPSNVRAEYIRRFRDGRLWQLVNVDLFGEGFDVPAVEVVSMGRPTASLAVYLQQFGRALRLLDGKAYGLVIDHVSNYKRHGLPDRGRNWSLDRREKRGKQDEDPEEIELTRCRTCSKPYERSRPACPHCGAVVPLPEPRARTLEMVDGALILLDPATLASMRAAATLASPADQQQRVEHVAGPIAGKAAFNRQTERIEAQRRVDEALAQWAGLQRHLGRSDEETMRRFYLTTGTDVLTARSGTRAELEKMAERIEGWVQI